MSITVREAIELKSLRNFKLLAGEHGLDRDIIKIGILDYEKDEYVEKNFDEGEFIISSLLVVKDNPEELEALVKKMISIGIAGLAIKNIYFKEVPQNIIDLCNKEEFPIFVYGDVYYEEVMIDVLEALRLSRERDALSERVEAILYHNLKNRAIEKVAYEMNRSFMDKNIVAYCIPKVKKEDMKGFWYKTEKDYPGSKIIPFNGGYIFISTFDKIDPLEAEEVVERRIRNSGVDRSKYYIGIGTLHRELGELNYSIREAVYAARFSRIYNNNISKFGGLGANKLILPILDDPWVKRYYEDIILPIMRYDEKNDTQLLETAKIYIEKNGDIKATAEQIFQHGNTVRYRIDRIYKLLEKTNSPINYYEDLAMAIRIYSLLKQGTL